MSLRYFCSRLINNGRHLQRLLFSNRYSANIPNHSVYKSKSIIINSNFRGGQSVPRHSALRNVGISAGLHARKLFIENVLCKVSHCVNSQVKRLVTRRLFFGDAAPLFAFVGVSLAAGSGVLSREDELEGLCWEIRNAVSKFQWVMVTDDGNDTLLSNDITLQDISIGDPIAKGCSAVVYAAKINDIQNEQSSQKEVFDTDTLKVEPDTAQYSNLTEFPLALKMMFNYDVQSSSLAILRAMFQETVPARRFLANEETSYWESSLRKNNTRLPPHPNVVAMYSVFADYMPQLPGSMQLYPDALPLRFNSEGFGRNMTLFLLMKRYQYSLAEFLKQHQLTQRDCILLLAQLLEGIVHMNSHGVAHRDLKSDNILVDWVAADDDNSVPILVVSDFGNCVADQVYGLEIPYKTEQIDKGGNMTLMAPEVILQTPGTFSILNYTKSDLWAAGTIAYEIFGCPNPFYTLERRTNRDIDVLRNVSYKESQLPSIGEKAPKIIEKLIFNMLRRNPNSRLSPEVASNVCQLYLWAPSSWLKSERLPESQEILQWLLCLTTKVLCEGRLSNQPLQGDFESREVPSVSRPKVDTIRKSERRSHPEYILIASFLCRAKLSTIKQALHWIQVNI